MALLLYMDIRSDAAVRECFMEPSRPGCSSLPAARKRPPRRKRSRPGAFSYFVTPCLHESHNATYARKIARGCLRAAAPSRINARKGQGVSRREKAGKYRAGGRKQAHFRTGRLPHCLI